MLLKFNFYFQLQKKSFFLLNVIYCNLIFQSAIEPMQDARSEQQCKILKNVLNEFKINIETIKGRNSIIISEFTSDFCIDRNSLVPEWYINLSSLDIRMLHSREELGGSGANVFVFYQKNDSIKNQENKIVVKKFLDKDKGMQELLNSLVAMDFVFKELTRPCTKMACVLNAAIFSNVFCLLTEGVNTRAIRDLLSTPERSTCAVRGCAQYLAEFHKKMHEKQRSILKEKEWKEVVHYLKGYQSHLLEYGIKKYGSWSCSESQICIRMRLAFEGQQEILSSITSQIAEIEKKFESFNSISMFEEAKGNPNKKYSSDAIYREVLKFIAKKGYFFTITHGDAHIGNFIYNEQEDGCSSSQITMIDFETIARSIRRFSDPAEDVGRFLGSLWAWRARGLTNQATFKTFNGFQKEFLTTYEYENNVDLKNCLLQFKNNCEFYKLRYYKYFVSDLFPNITPKELIIFRYLKQFFPKIYHYDISGIILECYCLINTLSSNEKIQKLFSSWIKEKNKK